MSDPLAEVIAMLNLRAVLTKPSRAGDWRVRRSDQGCHLWRRAGRRLSAGIDQHEPQILRAGDLFDPGGVPLLATSLTSPLHRRWKPSRCNWRRDTFGWAPRQACAHAGADWPLRFRFNERQPAGLAVASLCGGPQSTAAGHLCRAAERGSAGGSRGQIFRSGANG